MHGWIPKALRRGASSSAYAPVQLELATGGPRDPAWLMTLDDLTRELAPLDLEVGREVRREIHEGPHHAGPSATVQIRAVRQ